MISAPRRRAWSWSRARASIAAASGTRAPTSQTSALGRGAAIHGCRPRGTGKLIGGAGDDFCRAQWSTPAVVRDEQRRRPMTLEGRTRWFALYVLCLGSLMIVLDVTIVNVALPSIRQDLGFSETSLAWVVNAYLLTYGGFLLLGGRLGDLFGHRRLFIAGITVFTLASLACGLATTQWFLIAARSVQGLGGAVASAVSLSLMMGLFTEPADRAKAMGIFGFVASGGGSIGVLLGGVLTDTLSWHWIFLVNFPIGILVVLLTLRLVPAAPSAAGGRRLEPARARTAPASLLLAVY